METTKSFKVRLVFSVFLMIIPCVTALGDGKASNPNPPDGGRTDDPSVTLTWTSGDNAIMHHLYFGTDQGAVAAAEVGNPMGVYRGPLNSETTSYLLDPLTMGIYYWRIDEVIETDPIIEICKGDVWCFGVGIKPGAIYVDADAPAGGSGTSWANAYRYLQDALFKPPSSGDEIWVAAGTYKPDVDEGGNVPLNDRTATFKLISGVALYGGFAGGESSLDDRDWEINQTVLSGDVGTDDDESDNCYHVVTGYDMDEMTILDGFTITRGNADGSNPYSHGGGMYTENCERLVVANCTFTRNRADDGGGGMNNVGGSPTVTDCTFTYNFAAEYIGAEYIGYGGGMRATNTTVTNCRFISNYATFGGGMSAANTTVTNCIFSDNCELFGPPFCHSIYRGAGLSIGGDSTVTNCSFGANVAFEGGGMIAYDGVTVRNCRFSGNYARDYGGGLFNESGQQTVTNCKFHGNLSYGRGGGMFNIGSPIVTNCTFTGNVAEGLMCGYGGGMHCMGLSPTVTNCIFWGDTPDEIGGTAPAITYSDIQDGTDQPWFGTGCIDADPQFSDAHKRLSVGSPCHNAGSNAAVPADVTTDLDGNPRIVGPEVDMGAYECQTPTPDQDGDGIEDSIDTMPTTYSWCFADAAGTSGAIILPGDQTLTIADEDEPDGVWIIANAAGGPMRAVLSVCGGTMLTFGAGDEAVIKCGSVTVEVISGTVGIEFTAGDGTPVATNLAQGNTLEFEPETLTVFAPEENEDTVVVSVDGREYSLAPGQTLDIAPTISDLLATPDELWPPNHKVVEVLLSGHVVDHEDGLAEVWLVVDDEYGEVSDEPGYITDLLDGDGVFEELPVELIAWRDGDDLDGRIYTIVVYAIDNEENLTEETVQVIVPHDKGK